jgi:uncharacterized protein (DUF1499 family)
VLTWRSVVAAVTSKRELLAIPPLTFWNDSNEQRYNIDAFRWERLTQMSDLIVSRRRKEGIRATMSRFSP